MKNINCHLKTGTGKLISQAEILKPKSVTTFQYLMGTYPPDDEEGLLYKVTRLGIHKSYVVCWRCLVLLTVHFKKKTSNP